MARWIKKLKSKKTILADFQVFDPTISGIHIENDGTDLVVETTKTTLDQSLIDSILNYQFWEFDNLDSLAHIENTKKDTGPVDPK